MDFYSSYKSTPQELLKEMLHFKNKVENTRIDIEDLNIFLAKFEEVKQKLLDNLNLETETSNEALNFYMKEIEIECLFALRKLPIYKYKNQILNSTFENQAVIVTAETGSGKTTQLCQYYLLNSINCNQLVFVTQPRKLAAASVSKRVREELNVDYGMVSTVLDKSELHRLNHSRGIVFLTESCFLNYLLIEIKQGKNLDLCSLLILDEAHERSLEFDVILGLLKKYILPLNSLYFRLIITSATVKVKEFSEFLNGAPIIECKGKCYPVKIHYLSAYDNYFHETLNMVDRVVNGKVQKLNFVNETILVFLTGKEEIHKAKEILKNKLSMHLNKIEIFTLYGRLDSNEQKSALTASKSYLRIVLSTNLAESSLTVPNVSVVIDCGREKIGKYSTAQGLVDISVKHISKTSAIQRAGRAGRVRSGDCYRIYTELEHDQMPDFKDPAILNSHLGILILKFMKYDICDIRNFPLLDMPRIDAIRPSYIELYLLGAFESDKQLRNIKITPLGNLLADLEIEPMLGKMIYHSYMIFGCSEETLTIACVVKSCSYLFEAKDPNLYDLVQSPSDFPVLNRTEMPQILVDLKEIFETNYLLEPELISLGECLMVLLAARQ